MVSISFLCLSLYWHANLNTDGPYDREVNEMEHEEDRDKVLVPVLRHETIHEKELSEELPEESDEVKMWEGQRRCRVY
jgi:hypothetical protein